MIERTIHITCPKGMPPILRREVEALGYEVVAELPAGVTLRGTLRDCMVLNLQLRTAMRVLWTLAEFSAWTPDDLYNHVSRIPWEEFIAEDGYFSVHTVVQTPSIDNTQYAGLRCKDAIVDRFRQVSGNRPDSGKETARTVVFLYWVGCTCTVSIDTSGNPLSNRGYRIHPGSAPLRENLAAAMLLETRWDCESAFVNPMCGSGTLAIEAALIACNVAPGLLRRNFGFMHVLGYDPAEWNALVAEARAATLPSPRAPIVATDISREAVADARDNAHAANVDRFIEFKVCDFRDTPVPPGPGVVIFNPPYGERLAAGDGYEQREEQRGPAQRLDARGGQPQSRGPAVRSFDPRGPAIRSFDPRGPSARPGFRAEPPAFRDEPRMDPAERAELEQLYTDIGLWLKATARGKLAYLLTSNQKLAKRVRLNPSHRVTLYNTQLECTFYEYEMRPADASDAPRRDA